MLRDTSSLQCTLSMRLYNEAAAHVDEIAERILQLGTHPESRYSEYLKVANHQRGLTVLLVA